MSARFLKRLVLSASGFFLTIVFVVQSGTFEHTSPTPPETGTPSGALRTNGGHAGALKILSEFRVIAEGRVVPYPGAEVVVGTEAAGRIVRMDVHEKTVVRKGALIAEVSGDILKADYALSSAQIMEAEADIHFFDREFQRESNLVARGAGTLQNLDVNRRGLDTSRARRAAALAGRERITAFLAKTRITAPIDGVVTARHVNVGEIIEVAARIVTITDLNQIRIEAEVDEFDTGRVVLGAGVRITAEGFHGASWTGKVEEIPDSVVARRIRPEDPGRPIDARVLPIKITFSERTPLKLGQRVEIEIISHQKH
jgi:HlyD family secretion protein